MTAETAADLCRYLNEITTLDPGAMYRLVEARVPCNGAVADHPTAQVCAVGDHTVVGFLGLFNGWLAQGGFVLFANVEQDDGIVTGFNVERVADAPADPEADPDGA